MNTKHNCKVKRIYGKPFAVKTSFQENKTWGDVEEELWKSFLSGNKQTPSEDDIYAEHAAILFRVDEKDVTSEQRQVAKRRLFGVRYGMTGASLDKMFTSKTPSVDEMKRVSRLIGLNTEGIALPPEIIPHFDFNTLKDNLNPIIDFKTSRNPRSAEDIAFKQRMDRHAFDQMILSENHRHFLEMSILSASIITGNTVCCVSIKPTPRFPHSIPSLKHVASMKEILIVV